MILITGGAGFIGSNLAAALEAQGHEIAVCDRLGSGDKWRNLAKRELAALVPPEGLTAFLAANERALETVFHLGAVSATTERDADLIIAQNFTLSLALWEWCAAKRKRFFYASSAATYGDGGAGFDDDGSPAALAQLRPLNPYGWSNAAPPASPPPRRRCRRNGSASNSSTSTAPTSITRATCRASSRKSIRALPQANRAGSSARTAPGSPMAARSATLSRSKTASP